MTSRGKCARVLGWLAAIGIMAFVFDLHMRPAHADTGPVLTYSDRIASTLEVGAEHENTLSLSAQPSSDLTITFVSMDPSVVGLSNGYSTPSERVSVVFAPTDWQAPRAVRVTALAEGSTVIAQRIQSGNDSDRYRVWPIDVTAVNCAAGQVAPCERDVFGVAVYPIINGDLIGQPDEAELEIRWSTSLDYASITSFKLEWKYGAREFASQTPKILDPALSLLPFGSSQSVTSKRYRYVLDGLPQVDVPYGIRITAVTDEGEGTPSAPGFATPTLTYPTGTGGLEEAAILPTFIEREIMAIHETDHPWLRQVWDYLLEQNTKIIYWPTSDNSQVATACDAYVPSATELVSCRPQHFAIGGGTHKPGGGRHFVDKTVYHITHELAHVYTLSNNVSKTPGPIGQAHLYFQTQSQGGGQASCESEELFADMWVIATLGDKAKEFPYSLYASLCPTSQAWTKSARAVVNSALAGQTPQWFSTRYGRLKPDLELLWADITDLSLRNDQATIIHQLQDMFGGYCDVRATSATAFGSGNVRNPWRDGGCVPGAPSSLSATSTGNGSLALSWQAPQDDGGAPIEGYKVQWKSGSQEYDSSRQAVIAEATATDHTLTGFTNGQSYNVKMWTYNQQGDGDSIETTSILSDTTAPRLVDARISGKSLYLTWNETLDSASVPPKSAFAVSVGGSGRTVLHVGVWKNMVRLRLATAVNLGQGVALDYNMPSGAQAKPLRDDAGNAVASLSTLTVRNDTTQTRITSTPSINQTYIYRNGLGNEDTIELTVRFPQAVVVTGKPAVHVEIGQRLRRARYVSGSGTSSLVFRYTLIEGELDSDGISVPAADILMDSGTVRYAARRTVAPGEVSLADQANHLVDSVRPSLVSILATEGDNEVRLTFDKALDEQSVPPPSYRNEFGYDVLPFPSDVYAPIEVTAVVITGKVVTLTLAANISASDGLVVRHYQQLYKGQPPLQGALGNQVQPIWEVPISFE